MLMYIIIEYLSRQGKRPAYSFAFFDLYFDLYFIDTLRYSTILYGIAGKRKRRESLEIPGVSLVENRRFELLTF